jgi:saccharopine dehydrogenase-like NADP-dependent oxidoreductase
MGPKAWDHSGPWMTAMYPVLLVGAGKIGEAVAKFLADTREYDVLVVDVDPASLDRLAGEGGVRTRVVDVMDAHELADAMSGRRAVLSAVSYAQNPAIAAGALEHGLTYFDLTEDVVTTRIIRGLSESARPGQIFMPQCGLAPGFVSIATNALAGYFDSVSELRLRVGALPVFPTNEMKYNLTWSTDGLINEYGNPCEAIHEGKLINLLPLEGLEQFNLDGVDYEAFNTSGGVGTLAETFEGRAQTLNYKTIRYRGHRALMKFLMFDLHMNEHRGQLKEIFERAVPVTLQDLVLIFCTVKGRKDGRYVEMTDARKVYAGEFRGRFCSAIQTTTAAAMCAVLDMHVAGRLPTQGFVKQEQVPLKDFLENRFGCAYDVNTPRPKP